MIRVAGAALHAGIAVQRDLAEARRVLELARLRDEMLSATDSRCKLLGVVIQEMVNRAVLSSLARADSDGTFASQLAQWRSYGKDIRFGPGRARSLILSLDRGMAGALRGPLARKDDWTDDELIEEIEKQSGVNGELLSTWEKWKRYNGYTPMMMLPPEVADNPEAAANLAFSIALFVARENTRLNALILALLDSGTPWSSDLRAHISRHLPAKSGERAGGDRLTPRSVESMKGHAFPDEAEFQENVAYLMRPFLPHELLRDHLQMDLRDPEILTPFGGTGYLLPPGN